MVSELYTDHLFELSLRKENILTKTARVLGLTATFRAAWIDEETKRQFVVEITEPKREEREYAIWRKLNPITDTIGTVIPFGMMANVSSTSAARELSEAQRRAVSGKLAWQGI